MTLFELAGYPVGVRELAAFLVLGLVIYIGVVILRVRALDASRRGAASLRVPVVPAPVQEEPVLGELSGERLDPPPLRAPPSLATHLVTDALEEQVRQLRDEVDALRGELAAMRQDMQSELAQFRATQTVAPIYGDAMQMAVAGRDAATIAERCGIARAEAELVVALANSRLE